MLNADQIVSAWLEGSEVVAGIANPAGSLHISSQSTGDNSNMLQTVAILCDLSTSSNTCFG